MYPLNRGDFLNNYIITINAEQVNLMFGASDPDESRASAPEVDSLSSALVKQMIREKFEPNKKNNLLLADAYQIAGLTNGADKAVRLAACARWLEFALPPDAADKRYKVVKTTSCHVRLCPVCQWRRSLNTFRNLAQIYEAVPGYKHLFLTLTQKNVEGEALADEIKKISDAFTKMMRRKPWKDIVKGYTRTIEVTISKDGTFHPHIHAILTVSKSYGSKNYLSQNKVCEEWQKALCTDYKPVCDIRAIKNMNGKAIAEVAKYSVKPADYINGDAFHIAEIVKWLDSALDGKRFISYGGIIKDKKQEIFSKVNLEDIEAETIPKTEWENWERVIYEWHFYAQKYNKITV